MKTYARIASLLVVLIAPAFWVHASPAGGQAKDPFLGTWMLDSDKSTFVPGPVPEDRTMTFEAKADGLHNITRTRNLFLGGTDDIDYTAKFDGKDYPITGTGLDTVSLKRVDANTIERTGKVHGKVTESCTMKIAPDGKTLTMTVKGSYNGTDYHSTQVFERD
jgi:hypothetical protein